MPARKEERSTDQPFGDLTKMLEQFKVPGVDMSSLVDARRKDIEALVPANKTVYEGMQALAQKQSEMLNRRSRASRTLRKSATPRWATRSSRLNWRARPAKRRWAT